MSARICILSTKVLDDRLLKKEAEHFLDFTCLPFIESRPINSDHLIASISALLEKQITAIFTSSKSVAVVASMLRKQPRWVIYCLFGATKQNVQKYFPESVVHAEAKDSAALAEQIIKGELKEVHFFCGNKRMDTIPEKLADTQLVLHQHTVYTTQATPHKITQQYNGILFFSPSAVESFFSLNKIDEKVKCFAVGNTTARSLTPFTNNIIIADTASGEAMLSKVKEIYCAAFPSPLGEGGRRPDEVF